MILLGIGFFSCDDITKGYLEVAEAGYATDTLFIALDPGSRDSIPYQSEVIQGVIGTFPIFYELAAVRDERGQAVDVSVASQIKVVRKAAFEIAKDHTIPVGGYTLDLRVWNMGRSFILEGIYTLVVQTAETGASFMEGTIGEVCQKDLDSVGIYR